MLSDAAPAQTSVQFFCSDLDVLPGSATKGGTLDWLCRHESVPLERVLVAGDTGNDASMFLLPGVRGIVVENAQPELIEAVIKAPTFNATRVVADEVLEGLEHFGVIPAAPQPAVSALRAEQMDPTLRMLFTEAALGSLTSAERDLIAAGYRHALDALRKNITPLGFSACSLADNEVTGTDVNYRSVWARDGCIAIIGSIELNDAEIRRAQEATLRSLFDRLASNGQVPANVRLDDGAPDYSGVGGICSIGSACTKSPAGNCSSWRSSTGSARTRSGNSTSGSTAGRAGRWVSAFKPGPLRLIFTLARNCRSIRNNLPMDRTIEDNNTRRVGNR